MRFFPLAPHDGPGRAVISAAAVLLAIATTRLAAQDFERYRPKAPVSEEGEAELPPLPKPAEGSTRVLVDELKGLVFVDHPDKVVVDKLDVSGIHVEGSGLWLLRSGALQRRIAPYLGGPITILRLNEIAREVIIFYRQNDQPVVDVSVPEQDITDGVVQVVVTEARVGRIRVEGACFFDPYMLAEQVWTCPGDRIYESVLLADLKWLNLNPFREVDLELTPGAQFGQTDVVFNVHDHCPVRVYTGYEDTGVPATELERIIFGVNWGNALWRDHQLGYQYTTSGDFEALRAHSGTYYIPLLNRDSIVVYGGWAELVSNVSQPADLEGKAWQADIRYYYTLNPWPYYEHRLSLGFDFKQTNTNLEFGGSTVTDADADVAQIAVGYEGLRRCRNGTLSIGADMFISPSRFSPDNNDQAFQQLRAFARARYIYARAYAHRQIYLPWSLMLSTRVTGQVADANLLASEQLGFGGYDSVRGYDMRLVNGDSGYLVNVEVLTDPFSLGLGRRNQDQLQLLTFFDMGGALNHTLLPGEESNVELYSVGIGARYAMAPHLSFRFDYGWQLKSVPNDPNDSRVHLGLVVSR